MNNSIVNKEYIETALLSSRLAVLATEGNGQPHASLIAVTPLEGVRQLIFATYRNTRKYTNLIQNGKVAVLMESENNSNSELPERFVITAFGHAREIVFPEKISVLREHQKRHPELESFLQSTDCALVRITVHAYQLVRGIEEVEWWTTDDLDGLIL